MNYIEYAVKRGFASGAVAPTPAKVTRPACRCDLRSVLMVTGCKCGGV